MCLLAALVIVAGNLLQGQALVFRTVDKGGQSDIEQSQQVVVRSADAWTALWASHARAREQPDVDFQTETVLGLFLGRRPTGGFSVEIVSATARDGALVIAYRETRPSPGVMTVQILTSPYHLVTVPAWHGDVRFENVP